MTARGGEFGFIAALAEQLADAPEALNLADDAAVLSVGARKKLIIVADMLQAGVHAMADATPAQIACKALRANLSDLAAMGAMPAFYLSTISWPGAPTPEQSAALIAALAKEQDVFDVSLIGGDTICGTGPFNISITALGWAEGRVLRRCGANPGDEVWVSGTIGDGYLGLLVAQGALATLAKEDAQFLLRRYEYPEPRIKLGVALAGFAHCGLDISDGLVADAAHLARQSQCAIQIMAEQVPVSPAAQHWLAQQADVEAARARLWAGGDDYELLFCAAPTQRAKIQALSATLGLDLTCIGACVERTDAAGDVFFSKADGQIDTISGGGFTHF